MHAVLGSNTNSCKWHKSAAQLFVCKRKENNVGLKPLYQDISNESILFLNFQHVLYNNIWYCHASITKAMKRKIMTKMD